MRIQISLRLDVVVSISLIVPRLSPSLSWPKIKQVKMVCRKKGGNVANPLSVRRGQDRRREVNSYARGAEGRITWAQSQAQTVATFFCDRIPTVVRNAIDTLEKELWERVKTTPMEEIREEVEEWVMDLRTTRRRVYAYEHLMMAYWVVKNLMSHVTMEGKNKRQGK